LARAFGHDPVRATWLAILNPLVLFALVTPGHNDLLMVGLMVAGVTLAVERRPLMGIALCAVAATVKLPALLAAAFLAVAWARSEPVVAERAKRLAWAAAVTLVVVGVVTLVAGVGASWVTSTLFSAPARVKLAITPSSGLACTVATVTSSCTKAHIATLQSVFRGLFGAVTILLVLELLRRTRRSNVARYTGLALIALAFGGPAAWPWYLVWGLALLATAPTTRTVIWSLVIIVAGAFLVKPSGQLAVPLQSAPWLVAVYVVAAILVWYSLRYGRHAGPPDTPGPAPSGVNDAREPVPQSVLAK
jgi:alpha-1,6-mannosyltransferase